FLPFTDAAADAHSAERETAPDG
ncbi:MAG: hypothetical protein QOI15_864, partial [Pseudonocardiales bacterium]|nr:hypothetical protein [Pseudonocardiales bacterium]